MAQRRSKIQREQEIDEMVDEIAEQKVAAIHKAVNFGPVSGAPRWVIELLLPDLEPLFEKPRQQWTEAEIATVQESVNTLPIRLLALAAMEPLEI